MQAGGSAAHKEESQHGGTSDVSLSRAWVDAARAVLERRIWPLLSGIALPAPAQLLASLLRSPDVDTEAAAELRQAVEGSILHRAASSGGLEAARRVSADGSEPGASGLSAAALSARLRGSQETSAVLRSPRSRRALNEAEVQSAPKSASSPGDGGLDGSPRGPLPIVFMHGVGLGVFPYLGFVRKLLLAFRGTRQSRRPACRFDAPASFLLQRGRMARGPAQPLPGSAPPPACSLNSSAGSQLRAAVSLRSAPGQSELAGPFEEDDGRRACLRNQQRWGGVGRHAVKSCCDRCLATSRVLARVAASSPVTPAAAPVRDLERRPALHPARGEARLAAPLHARARR